MKNFLNFLREQGVVGLAIGFILGASVGKVVASLVNDVLQPVIGMVLGSPEGLADLHYGPVRYGQFLVVLIDFVIVAAVVYFVFSRLKLDRLDKKKNS